MDSIEEKKVSKELRITSACMRMQTFHAIIGQNSEHGDLKYMHELGIVTYVARQVDEVAAENKIEEIAEVVIEIGEVSGIVPEFLTDAWDYFRKNYPVLAHSKLRCEMIKAFTFCDDCQKTYPTVQYGKTCPYCGGGNTWLLVGRECNIKEILVPDDEEDDT